MDWRPLLPALAALAVGLATAADFAPPGTPAVQLTFEDGTDRPPLPPDAALEPGRDGQAMYLSGKPLALPAPQGFDWEQGTIRLWARPGTDCRDDAYRCFFDVQQAGKGRIYLIKSGTGGANGLFLCVVDETGTWRAANVAPGSAYSWRAGEWHHLGGSWDSRRGIIKLFFDGKELLTRKLAPFHIGSVGNTFFVGGNAGGTQMPGGLVDDVCLFAGVATQTPIAYAASSRSPEHTAWRAIDGDTADTAGWDGQGCPNWLAVELPEPIALARVTVHPGALRYAPYPSTECAPRTITVQGWTNDSWEALAAETPVPRYVGSGGPHQVVINTEVRTVRRFRLWMESTTDEGKRVSSPDKPIVPPEERSVVLREVTWQSAAEVAREEQKIEALRAGLQAELTAWTEAMRDSGGNSLLSALTAHYGPQLAAMQQRLARLSGSTGIEAATERAEHLRHWLTPWQQCLKQTLRRPETPWPGEAVGRLWLRVDAGDTAHEFYPASVPLDLAIAQAVIGIAIDPCDIRVVEVGSETRQPVPFAPFADGGTSSALYCPARFEQITPGRGTLWWTLKDRTHTLFTVELRARRDAPPPEGGLRTLGNCDPLYFEDVVEAPLPGNMWSAVFLDWDGDGRQDLLGGRWTDFCHLWRNVGTARSPAFSEREHWLLTDELDRLIAASTDHHGLAFSMAFPVDFDSDGRMDLFVSNYYGRVPAFYRNLGGTPFPVLANGQPPIGLGPGKIAFGDLNGDGKPDAVVVKRHKDSDSLLLYPGNGLTPEGRPLFGEAQTLELVGERTSLAGARTAPALADIDADGDLDLFLYTAPHLWQYDNTGSARSPQFGEGTLVQREGRPFESSYYYPYVSWSDADGDGDLDLTKSTGVYVYRNEGDRAQLRLGKQWRPTVRAQKTIPRPGLKTFAMVDWDKDGDLDHVQLSWRGMDLQVSEFQDGLFRGSSVVEVDPNKREWYGCPDTTEYFALYGNVQLVDWDGDEDLDLFVASEHSWRFGYIHYYQNQGEYRFAPEVRLRPDPRCDYVEFVPGRRGQAAQVTARTFLDYLSFPTTGHFPREGGSIRFAFRPLWRPDDDRPHYLFHTVRNPATAGVSARDLHHYYIGMKSDLTLPPPFALLRTAEGRLRFQAWSLCLESPPLGWEAGAWHDVEIGWGAAGAYLAIDRKRVAESSEACGGDDVGRRLFIGSQSVMHVQHEREYPSRWQGHPKDWTFPADGAFDEFQIRDAAGTQLLTLPFDGDCDTREGVSGRRSRVGYRCTPGFADLNADGHLDMVMMMSDGRRGSGAKPEHRDWGKGRLFLFTNTGETTQPGLEAGVLLRHPDGSPFDCHIRTQATCVDWDRDGLTDLILSTENYGPGRNRAVCLSRNVGTREKPVFATPEPMTRLNELITPHHEVKVCAVDLTGNGKRDLVTATDPGTRVTYRSFLEEAPVRVRFLGLETSGSGP